VKLQDDKFQQVIKVILKCITKLDNLTMEYEMV